MPERVVVIGASLAGLRATQALRRHGYSGAVTLVGREASLPYDRPPLSKAYLEPGAAEPDTPTLSTEAELRQELGVDIRLGTQAERLDTAQRSVSLVGPSGHIDLDYDAVIIATGATPHRLPNSEGIGGVHVLRTIEDASAIRKALQAKPRTVIVGAGFIGSEVASSIRGHGLPVTIVEALPVPFARSVGHWAGRACAELHQRYGTELVCDRLVSELSAAGGRVAGVRLDDGSELPADLVVVGTGVAPNTSWLRGSGILLDEQDGGIVCDGALRTTAADVYAAGDVAHVPHPLMDGRRLRLEHWTNAAEQGALAAYNLLNPSKVKTYNSVPYFWSDWYGHRIQFVGVADCDEMRCVSAERGEEKFLALYRRGNRVVGCLAIDRPGQIMKYQRMIAKAMDWREVLEFAGVQGSPSRLPVRDGR